MYCKQCGVKLDEEDYVYMDYCESCFEKYGKEELKEEEEKIAKIPLRVNIDNEYVHNSNCITGYSSNKGEKQQEEIEETGRNVKNKNTIIQCPFCSSKDYQIVNDNSTGYFWWGLLIAIILFVIGNFTIRMIAGIIVISVILTAIINKANSDTLVVRCKKCNQKYKISRQDLKK